MPQLQQQFAQLTQSFNQLLATFQMHLHTGSDGSQKITTPTTTSTQVAFVGNVNSNGTASTPFPTGWSSSRITTGIYTITHNLGSTNYAVVATAIGGNSVVHINSPGSTTFGIIPESVGSTPVGQDTQFYFNLSLA